MRIIDSTHISNIRVQGVHFNESPVAVRHDHAFIQTDGVCHCDGENTPDPDFDLQCRRCHRPFLNVVSHVKRGAENG